MAVSVTCAILGFSLLEFFSFWSFVISLPPFPQYLLACFYDSYTLDIPKASSFDTPLCRFPLDTPFQSLDPPLHFLALEISLLEKSHVYFPVHISLRWLP